MTSERCACFSGSCSSILVEAHFCLGAVSMLDFVVSFEGNIFWQLYLLWLFLCNSMDICLFSYCFHTSYLLDLKLMRYTMNNIQDYGKFTGSWQLIRGSVVPYITVGRSSPLNENIFSDRFLVSTYSVPIIRCLVG
jgi:hypothetical protein